MIGAIGELSEIAKKSRDLRRNKKEKEEFPMMECKETTSLESYFLFLANFSHDRAREVTFLSGTKHQSC